MREASLNFLRTLANTPSPTGNEVLGQRVWLDYVKPWAARTFSDAYGNCVAVINPGGSPRVMLAAHADEIALTVNHITEEGYVHVLQRGGVDAAIMKAQRVNLHSTRPGVKTVKGVVGNLPPHLSRDRDDARLPRIQDLCIDIGATSRKEAASLVRIGDLITLAAEFEVLRNDRVVARALDNRIGTFAVAETLRLLSGAGGLQAEVNVVSNVQEEVGLMGIRQIAYTVHPDLALIVDVTHATDYPGVSKSRHGDIRLDGGPALTHGGCNHSGLVARLEAVARKAKIPLQHKAMSSTGGTDTDAVFWTRGGIPSALVSLPNRYMHSPVEMVSLKDLELIPRLLAGFARSLKKGETFKVVI